MPPIDTYARAAKGYQCILSYDGEYSCEFSVNRETRVPRRERLCRFFTASKQFRAGRRSFAAPPLKSERRIAGLWRGQAKFLFLRVRIL